MARQQLAAFGRLVERLLVLAYRNGEEWYDVHPMVRRDPMLAAKLGRRTRSGSRAASGLPPFATAFVPQFEEILTVLD